MGGYRYMTELWKKKQSDTMRFLRRIRAWNYRQLPRVYRATKSSRPDKARMLGYKKKPGYCVFRVRIRRGSRKRPNPKGIVYGKPANHVRKYFLFIQKYFIYPIIINKFFLINNLLNQ